METVKNSDTFGRGKEIFGLFEDGEFSFDPVVGHLCARRMILASAHTPLLRCVSVFAPHRETDGIVDASIKTRNALFPEVGEVW